MNICNKDPNILPHVPEKKLDTITKIFSVPANFFSMPKNVQALSPRIMIKGVTKDNIKLELWFWIWNILMREQIVSTFYSKLIEDFKKGNVKFG